MTPDVGTEASPQLLMPALAQQVQVEVAHRRRELIRVADREPAVTEIDVEPICGHYRTVQLTLKQSSRIEAPHRHHRVAHDNADGHRSVVPAPDHHAVASF